MDGPRPSILDALEHEPVVWLSTTRPTAVRTSCRSGSCGMVGQSWRSSKPHAQKVRNLRADPRVMVAVGRADASFDVELIEAVAELHDTSAALPQEFVRKYAYAPRRPGLDSRLSPTCTRSRS